MKSQKIMICLLNSNIALKNPQNFLEFYKDHGMLDKSNEKS